jgi:hypothetical protein
LPRPAAFIDASVALIVVVMSSGMPIPLYNTFRVITPLLVGGRVLQVIACGIGSSAAGALASGALIDFGCCWRARKP